MITSRTPIIVSVAPNGSRKTKQDHPNIPLTTEELVKETVRCRDAGATMMHLHIRDKKGEHTLDADQYKSTLKTIRKEVKDSIILQVTTESCEKYSVKEQMAVIRALKPESFSIAISEIMPSKDEEKAGADFLLWAHREHVAPQYVLYSEKEVSRFADLKKRGLIPGNKLSVLFVLGKYSKGMESHPAEVLPFIQSFSKAFLPETTSLSICAFGKTEAQCAISSAFLGGHVRIGFENNMHLHSGSLAQNNAELVKQFVGYSDLIGRSIASIDQARALMCGR